MSTDTTALNMTTVVKITMAATISIVSSTRCLLMTGLFVDNQKTLQNSVALKLKSTKVAMRLIGVKMCALTFTIAIISIQIVKATMDAIPIDVLTMKFLSLTGLTAMQSI